MYTKQISAETSTEKVLDETFLPQTPSREISTKQFSKETSTEKYVRKKSTKQMFKETIYQNHVQRYLYQKRSADKFSKKISHK